MQTEDTILIPLSPSGVAIIDAADEPLVSQYRWYAIKHNDKITYAHAVLHVDGRNHNLQMHRLIVAPPRSLCIDHIDGDGLNNRRSNMRIATLRQNQGNRRANHNNPSGFKGVRPRYGRWYARISIASKSRHLGVFDCAEEAARAYDEAAFAYFGEFALLNFPDSEAV